MPDQTHIAIHATGFGGYVAAIRAAPLRTRATVVQWDKLRGVCLSWDCIPSKAETLPFTLFGSE